MQRNRNLQGLEHLDSDYTDAREQAVGTQRPGQKGSRCGHRAKSVGASCVKRLAPVTTALRESVSDDLGQMAWYLMNRERLIREAVEAGEEAIAAFDRAEAQR